MLQIMIEEGDGEILITLAGCVAGPNVGDLFRVWAELAPQLRGRRVSIDLHGVTQWDPAGVQALGGIYTRTKARLLTDISDCLALEIMYGQVDGVLVDASEWVTN